MISWLICIRYSTTSFQALGAHVAAIIFKLVETCKYHKIKPYDYFKNVLNRLPQHKTLEEYQALLPFNLEKSLLAQN
jgi:hypothetical protein